MTARDDPVPIEPVDGKALSGSMPPNGDPPHELFGQSGIPDEEPAPISHSYEGRHRAPEA